MRRWLPIVFATMSYCPKDETKCNNDRQCDEDAGFRCQILENPETGKEEGHCVQGGDPVS